MWQHESNTTGVPRQGGLRIPHPIAVSCPADRFRDLNVQHGRQSGGRGRAAVYRVGSVYVHVGPQPNGIVCSAVSSPRIAAVTSDVPAFPPRSGVRRSVSANTRRMAVMTASAASGWPRWSSIIAADQIWAIGLATPVPAMSGADPWTGSDIDR